MRTTLKHLRLALAIALFTPGLLYAEGAAATAADSWHATSLGQALLYTGMFGLFGVLLAVGSYKLFDLCTPGDLHKEIVENKNMAAAIVGAAVILGVCIIIAAAIMG